MKKTAIKIAIYSALYVIFMLLINAVFIRPNLIRFYAKEPTEFVFLQAFIGIFVPISLLLPAFFVMFVNVCRKNLKRILILSTVYLVLTLAAFMFVLLPTFSISSVLFFMLMLISFMMFTYSLDFLLSTVRLPDHWRWLTVATIVVALLTSVLWINPILESQSNDADTLKTLANLSVIVNPAFVTIEEGFDINIFRSGNFYSHEGGEGLSLIGDYFGSADYLDPIILHPLIFLALSVFFFVPALIIRMVFLKSKSA